MRAMGGRPVLMQRFPQRRRRLVVLPEAGARRTRPTGSRPRSSARRTAPRREALVAADLAHVVWAVNLGCLGFHVWPDLAADDPSTPTSCASTSTRNPASTSTMSARRRARCSALLDELGIVGVPEDHRQPRHPRVRAARSRAGRRSRCARAAVAVARELARRRPDADHRRVVEGGARASGSSSTSTRTRRTRRCSARGRCGPGRARRCRRRSTGTSSTTIDPDALHHRRPCRRASTTRGDPWADIDDRPAVARAAARRCTSATSPPGCRTRRGRPSTRRCRASRRGWRPAGPRSRPPRRSRRPPRRRRRRRSAGS